MKFFKLLALPCFTMVMFLGSCTTAFESQKKTKEEQNKFTIFPAGNITPLGWMKGMENAAIKGYTGNFEGINKLAEHKMPLNSWMTISQKMHGWGALEEEGYYLDGLVRLAYISHDESLITKVKSKIDPVIKAQEADGFFLNPEMRKGFYEANLNQGLMNPKFTTHDDGEENPDQSKKETYDRLLPSKVSRYYWVCAVFNRGVLALYDATKDKKYIDFLYTFYKNIPEFVREVPKNNPISGTEMHFDRQLSNLEVLFGVADRLQDKALRNKGLRILKNQASGIKKSFLDKNFTYARVCHGVTFNEVYKIYATTVNCNKADYLQASENAFHFLKEENGQSYGVNSANEYLRGIGAFTSTELCDVVDWSWSLMWLMKSTGRAYYGDDIEKAFFNAYPAANDKYHKHVYVFAPNRIEGLKYKYRDEEHNFDYTQRPFCCTGNLNRELPNYIMHMIVKTQDKGLAFLLYGPNHLNGTIENKKIAITTTTDYPFRERINIHIDENRVGTLPLYFRIPRWCSNAKIEINGETKSVNIDKNGLVHFDRTWKVGDEITLIFPMEVKLVQGKEKKLVDLKTQQEMYVAPGASRIDTKAKVVSGAPYSYLMRGPLLYTKAFEDIDDNSGVSKSMDYQYALLPAESAVPVSITEKSVTDNWVWSYDNAPVILTIEAQKVSWKQSTEYGALPDHLFKADRSARRKIKMIPFGCAKFRMTMFPIAK